MLEASDTLTGAVTELAAGNVGAAYVLGQIMSESFAGLMMLLDIERISLRREEIWLLYRDVHHMDLDGFIQHVRAQAGDVNSLRARS